MIEFHEDSRDNTVQLGSLRIEGWVAQASCVACRGRLVHYAVFDALFCPGCNTWTSLQCTLPDCYLCAVRPERPLMRGQSERRNSGSWSRLMLVLGMALGGCSKLADVPKPTEAIIEGLGNHHMAVTATPEAQRYFDQGLRLAYAFNHPEAERSFRAACGARSGVRHVLVGHGAGAGPQHQPADGSRGGGTGVGSAVEGARRCGEGVRSRAGVHRGTHRALRRPGAGQPRAARQRLLPRDGAGGAAVLHRPRRAGALCRIADGPEALGLLEPAGPAQPRARRSWCRSSSAPSLPTR